MNKPVALIDSNTYAARGLGLLLEDIGCRAIIGGNAGAILSAMGTPADLQLIIAEQNPGGGRNGLEEALVVRAAAGWDVPILLLAARMYALPILLTMIPDAVAIFTPVDIPVLLAAISGCIKKR
ncbi:hypothetical protein ACFSM5_13570 [Lacibacterium aquatile]|uniref:Response regulatory domain-containing protein n=1 Tax=Lacibacterium aquatile TaxID=1168082 RepID=A0ABW5DTT7_9PROT